MAENRPAKPPVPTLFTIVAVLLAVALVGGSYLLGRELGTPASPSPSAPAPAALEVPKQLGGYTLAESQDTDPTPKAGQEVARGNYTDGKNKLVLLMVRPQQELEKFLTDGGVSDLQEMPSEGDETSASASASGSPSQAPVPELMCGKSSDTGFAACGKLVDGVGQLLYAATDVPQDQLAKLLLEVPS